MNNFLSALGVVYDDNDMLNIDKANVLKRKRVTREKESYLFKNSFLLQQNIMKIKCS